jgi:hypothetical protein
MRKILTLLILFLLFANCAGLQKIDPIDPGSALKEFCNPDDMALPELDPVTGNPILPEQWVKVKDVWTIQEANAKCGREAIRIASFNYQAAKKNEPDGVIEDSGEIGIGVLFGIIIGVLLALP